ncbi:MAG: phosphoglycerate dehydrogenase, partial [Thermodesulfobacteriota bacterium]
MKVLVSDKLSEKGIEIFRNTPGIEVDINTGLTPEELKKTIKAYNGLAIRSGTKVTSDIIDAAENLKVIGRAGIGVDNVDIDAATKRGIVVMNTPGGNTVTTAEHAIAMMFSLSRNIPQATSSMREGKWEKKRFEGIELYNKTLGILGVGKIGSIVADRAIGLKMKVIAYDPYISEETANRIGIELVSLDDLYKRADFISIHLPLTPDTRNMIDAKAFKEMKEGVRLITCARGGIVNENDLYEAIKSGNVVGAALDVFESEPPEKSPLFSLEEVILTPHLGASTTEAQENVAIDIAGQISDYLLKGIIRNAVNVPSVSPEVVATVGPYLSLAEKLGSLQGQLVTDNIEEVTVEYSGDVVDYDIAPITIAALKGLLQHILDQYVNYVNAPMIAKERGIKVVEVRSQRPIDFASSIVIKIKGKGGESLIEGALFGKNDTRIVRINKFLFDAVPEGDILILHNYDKP